MALYNCKQNLGTPRVKIYLFLDNCVEALRIKEIDYIGQLSIHMQDYIGQLTIHMQDYIGQLTIHMQDPGTTFYCMYSRAKSNYYNNKFSFLKDFLEKI